MSNQKRAKVGGEVGVNGEFYQGGQFIATTDRVKGKAGKKSGKVQIDPYVWAIPDEGFQSLFKSKQVQCMDWRVYYDTGRVELVDAYLKLYDLELDRVQVTYLCEQYAKGYRFYQWTSQGWIFKK